MLITGTTGGIGKAIAELFLKEVKNMFMNILKSISKKTLVLLVTHNEALANFYSDYIYKIEDGKIVNHYENESSNSLQTSNDNVIYLKDMKELIKQLS